MVKSAGLNELIPDPVDEAEVGVRTRVDFGVNLLFPEMGEIGGCGCCC